jgi:hypothetical protein
MQSKTAIERTGSAALRRERAANVAYAPIHIPSWKIEAAFYFALVYSLAANVFGISIPMVAGASMLALAAACLWELRTTPKAAYGPLVVLLASMVVYLIVQIVVHGESIRGETARPFIVWMLQLVIVQSLCLRSGFSRRYPLVLFCVAALALPHLDYNPGTVDRAHVARELGLGGGLASVNGLGEWFGFLAVYFAVSGLEARRFSFRVGAWGLALVSLSVVGLTVSRGSMFAAVIAIIIAFRGILKRGFLPLLTLVILGGVVYGSGLLDQTVASYEERGTESTGREKIWPAVIERMLDHPIVGVGTSAIGTYMADSTEPQQPHNTFFYLALASGFLPMILFTLFFVRVGLRSHAYGRKDTDEAFRMPYLVFTLIVLMLGDLGVMAPWGLIAVSVAAGSAAIYASPEVFAVRMGNKVHLGVLSNSPVGGSVRDTTRGAEPTRGHRAR